jgi:DHA3 family macrolide efflux protein-like MFS transporter
MTQTLTNSHAPHEAEPLQDRPMRPFFILWTGQSLSLVGSQAVQFALIWWLTKTSGSATILASATLLGLLPPIVLGPVIGALIDRWNRKTVMLAADGFVAAASLLLAWLFSAGIANIPHVLALLFMRAIGAAFHSPAMTASTSLMVPEKRLTRIQGLNQSMQGLLTIVAAPLRRI